MPTDSWFWGIFVAKEVLVRSKERTVDEATIVKPIKQPIHVLGAPSGMREML